MWALGSAVLFTGAGTANLLTQRDALPGVSCSPDLHGKAGLGRMLWFAVSSLGTQVLLVYCLERKRGTGTSGLLLEPETISYLTDLKGRPGPETSRIQSSWERVQSVGGVGEEREKTFLGVLVSRRRPSRWRSVIKQLSEMSLACSYFFVGGGYGHIRFIWGEPGIP